MKEIKILLFSYDPNKRPNMPTHHGQVMYKSRIVTPTCSNLPRKQPLYLQYTAPETRLSDLQTAISSDNLGS